MEIFFSLKMTGHPPEDPRLFKSGALFYIPFGIYAANLYSISLAPDLEKCVILIPNFNF